MRKYHFPFMFHGTTEEYVRRIMSSPRKAMFSTDTYSPVSQLALAWTCNHSKHFKSKPSIIVLRDVDLGRNLVAVDCVDLFVDFSNCHNGRFYRMKETKYVRNHKKYVRDNIKRIKNGLTTLDFNHMFETLDVAQIQGQDPNQKIGSVRVYRSGELEEFIAKFVLDCNPQLRIRVEELK